MWVLLTLRCGSRCHIKLRCRCNMSHLYSLPADELRGLHCMVPQLCQIPKRGLLTTLKNCHQSKI